MHPKLRLILPLWALLVFVSLVPLRADQGQLQASHDENGVLVSEGDRPVLYYQRVTKSLDGKWPRADYVHPLHDLAGNVMTEDFPSDHRHHRGIFWAWHQVFVGEKMLGDPWVCSDFRWDVRSVESTSSASHLSLLADVQWKSPLHVDDSGAMIPVAAERVKITVHVADETYRLIDFEISLRALVDGVRIGGSDDEKGYGGFSPRIKLNDDQQFLSAAGKVEPASDAIEAGTWINITDGQSGLVMMMHRSNPAFTESGEGTDESHGRWILRRKRSMQNAVYPGRNPVPLPMENPTRLRYRLAVHDGSLDAEAISRLQQDYWESTR